MRLIRLNKEILIMKLFGCTCALCIGLAAAPALTGSEPECDSRSICRRSDGDLPHTHERDQNPSPSVGKPLAPMMSSVFEQHFLRRSLETALFGGRGSSSLAVAANLHAAHLRRRHGERGMIRTAAAAPAAWRSSRPSVNCADPEGRRCGITRSYFAQR